MKQKLSVF